MYMQRSNASDGVVSLLFFLFSVWTIVNLILIHVGRVRKETITTKEEELREEQEHKQYKQSQKSNGEVWKN
jgi:hypothetical protein